MGSRAAGGRKRTTVKCRSGQGCATNERVSATFSSADVVGESQFSRQSCEFHRTTARVAPVP